MIRIWLSEQIELPWFRISLLLHVVVLLLNNPVWDSRSDGIDCDYVESTAPKLFQYKVFLCLRIAFADFLGLLFSPTKSVDRLWHRHIMKNTMAYMRLCNVLGGHDNAFVHHREVSLADAGDDLRRTCKNFKTALQAVTRRWENPEHAAACVAVAAIGVPLVPVLADAPMQGPPPDLIDVDEYDEAGDDSEDGTWNCA